MTTPKDQREGDIPIGAFTTDPWSEETSAYTVRADMDRVKKDYRDAVGRMQLAHWERNGYSNHLGAAAGRSYRDGVWAGIQLVLNAQHAVDDLTTGELLAELRKGAGSIYWPVLAVDPKFHADCPRCERTVLIDAQGLCPECAHEFEVEG
jgi:hypothetical protein